MTSSTSLVSGVRPPEGVTTGNNTWTKVSVIPANNVYYEDTFITNNVTDTVGIEYGGNWTTVTEGSNAGEVDGTDDADDNHGWIDSMNDDAGYSDGTAAVATTSGASATFTFTGTGVDIYSRTNATAGRVTALLYQGTDTGAAVSKVLTIDNQSVSGDYYQIPTLSFTDLAHGTYTVKLIVSAVGTGDGARSTYYLDGIRVYNPLSEEQETNEDVQEAYDDEIGRDLYGSARYPARC